MFGLNSTLTSYAFIQILSLVQSPRKTSGQIITILSKTSPKCLRLIFNFHSPTRASALLLPVHHLEPYCLRCFSSRSTAVSVHSRCTKPHRVLAPLVNEVPHYRTTSATSHPLISPHSSFHSSSICRKLLKNPDHSSTFQQNIPRSKHSTQTGLVYK